MLNPYIIIGLLLGAVGLFGSGVSIGVRWERNDTLARIAVAQNTAIAAANAVAATQIERTVAAAKAEGQARLKARDIKHRGELDAAKKSRPECGRDDESLRLLIDAIDAANGNESAPSVVPDAVRPSLKTSGWLGIGGKALGIRSLGTDGGVSAAPR